jgi:dTDP-4-dehydrorhamnose reductase
VLVTGANGMLAQALVPALERSGHEVLGVDVQDADISRPDALRHALRTFPPDWIFHLAAFTRVDDCESRPDEAYRVNGFGARNVALAAAGAGAAILALSTDYVFDGSASSPYREYDRTNPQSVYGASKWAGEQGVREVHPRHIIVRAAWLYGRGGVNFVDTILKRAAAGKPLRVVDDQRGAPTWTEDLAPALIRLAERGLHGTFHVTNSGDCTWHEFARHIVERAGLEVPVATTSSAALGRPAPRPAYSVLSNQFFEDGTGTRLPQWQEAVDRYLVTRLGLAR